MKNQNELGENYYEWQYLCPQCKYWVLVGMQWHLATYLGIDETFVKHPKFLLNENYYIAAETTWHVHKRDVYKNVKPAFYFHTTEKMIPAEDTHFQTMFTEDLSMWSGGTVQKDLLPAITAYANYLSEASKKFKLSMNECRDRFGRYTESQWKSLLN